MANRCFLLGNLGSDAELKVTAGGQSVLKFSLATSEKWTGKDGTKQEKTQWHRCVMWGERASKLAQYLSKGTKVCVEGSIEYSSYEKDGEKRYSTDIKVLDLEFCGGKGEKPAQRESTNDTGGTSEDFDVGTGGADDEIPF